MKPAELFDISGSTALVTGGTSGIGKMIAAGLAAAGAHVVIASRKAQAVTDTVAELAELGDFTGIVGDVSTPDSARALGADVVAVHSKLNILVNNAGVTWGAPLEDFPDHGWDKVLNTNLAGVFHLTVALLPALRAARENDDRASIINIGSVDGINVPEMDSFSYSASKAGLHQLTRHLAKKLAPEGITANAIAPGPFESRMMRFITEDPESLDRVRASVPLGRLGEPDDVAGLSIFLASAAGRYLTGTVIPLDGGGVGCGSPARLG
ncbi:SDR family oxidoreductase [Gordonia sp. HY442]|uniref:SDR family oxidoreductase n=1 Tax=Gordonia zhenghanii TaxID=2911516 RepID=UPI001F3E14D6|nr:SDR family oxidoreductase [Gordonia zhenghanii]MCF8602066.1 SDR family oxidoreductase [Gordonia zhenghanii]